MLASDRAKSQADLLRVIGAASGRKRSAPGMLERAAKEIAAKEDWRELNTHPCLPPLLLPPPPPLWDPPLADLPLLLFLPPDADCG